MSDTTVTGPTEKIDPMQDRVQALLEPDEKAKPVPELTDAEKETLDTLAKQLAEEARLAYVNYILAHTPTRMIEEMKTRITPPA